MQRANAIVRAAKIRRLNASSGTSAAMIAAKRRRIARTRPPGALVSHSREIKAIDIASANYDFVTTAAPPVLTLLNGIQTGAAFFNRIGSRVEMKSLHIRGSIQNQATGVGALLRMVLVYDRQPNGAAPAFTELYQSRDQAGAAATSSVSEINLDQRDRFVIIRDKSWFAPPCTNTAGVLTNGPSYPGDDQEFDVDEFVLLKGLTTHYKASTNPSLVADINTGALYITFFTGGTTASWRAGLGFRLRFDDV